jgi:transaldolase
MTSLLDQLKEMTVVVADTGDINSIREFRPRDATTNPSLITAAAQMTEYKEIVDEALRISARDAAEGADNATIVRLAIDRLAVEFGLRILEIVPGRVSTEVDARLSYDTEATIEKGRYLIGLYAAAGIPKERILIKIAATWEGIRAAEVLEREGIRCNLTLMFGLHQAIACADAGAQLISPFVGRILDWYKKETGRDSYPSDEDPGVLSVTEIFNYYKKFGYKTEIMGASFRNLGEICELAGCDLLTISPQLLTQLQQGQGALPLKLDAAAAAQMNIERLHIDKAAFDRMHAVDRMANEKLDEGIKGFSKAIEALEKLLTERLVVLQGASRANTAAQEMFKIFDLDGDGVITREEWAGSDAVFEALDSNHDGAISPEEMAAGLGAAFHLAE